MADFSEALRNLKAGRRVQRVGWNGKGMWLRLVDNEDWRPAMVLAVDLDMYGGKKLLPWVGMKTADDKFVPWLCSQTDMLAEDWQVVG